MPKSKPTIKQILGKQPGKSGGGGGKKPEAAPSPLIIAFSRETGSGGDLIAQHVARALHYPIYDHELIQKVAESANTSASVVAAVDEKWRSVMEDWIADWANRRRLWLDDYLKHLMKVIGAIAQKGHSVIVGRGANFILSRDDFFRVLRVRILAPFDERVAAIAQEKNLSPEEATKYVNRTDADRRAFIRKYFNAAIDDPMNYDLLINMEKMTIEDAVAIIIATAREMEKS
ncbi:MAG: cytidylate kinase-like family protein [Myxococcales bacterium]|nr:cytidylate kinase-like family protein [Myxococcales bacterium]